MALWITTNYQIYPGWNNAGSLALITSYQGADNVYFIEPLGIPNASRGESRIMANGVPDWRGYPAIDWIFGYITFKQWEYAKTNWEGLVTIKTALNSSTFTNYNAVLRLDDPNQMTYDNGLRTAAYCGGAFINAPFHLTQLEAL